VSCFGLITFVHFSGTSGCISRTCTLAGRFLARKYDARQLTSGDYAAGTHKIDSDGKNDAGTMVSSGAYFCVFRAYDAQKGGMMLVRKIAIVKSDGEMECSFKCRKRMI